MDYTVSPFDCFNFFFRFHLYFSIISLMVFCHVEKFMSASIRYRILMVFFLKKNTIRILYRILCSPFIATFGELQKFPERMFCPCALVTQ